MKRTESDLVRACLQYLRSRGIFCWRNNSGAWKVGKRFIRFGCPGSGDIFGIGAGGRFISVETKLAGRKPTCAQEEWGMRVRQAGGLALIVHSVQELEELLR